MSLLTQSVRSLHRQLIDKEVTVTELTRESLDRIEQVDEKVKAFITVDREGALASADTLDKQAAANGPTNPLFGIPAALKDNILTEGLLTTCASQHLANYVPVYDATVTRKLKEAGAVITGKLNMDEFAMGSSTENSYFYPTRNPWNTDYVAGGSSGGSAAAVAAGEVSFALGSDTGGSIRQPASYCGVVGMKPTYGLVSRYGVVAFASSLDQVGPLARTVEDAAYVLQSIAGHDELDSTSIQTAVPDYAAGLTGDIRGLRIALPKEFMGEGIAPGVKANVQEAIHALERLGAIIEEVSLPHTGYAVACYYILASSEASANLSRFDGIRYGVRADDTTNLLDVYVKSRSEGFGEEVKRRIMLGTYTLSSGYYDAYYIKAQKVRTLIKQDFDQVFGKYDLIVGPTVPRTAFKLGEQFEDPLTMYLNDILTIPVNLAGLPAISVPCGLSDGMPVGLQLIAGPFKESVLLRAAHAFEQHTDHHKVSPRING